MGWELWASRMPCSIALFVAVIAVVVEFMGLKGIILVMKLRADNEKSNGCQRTDDDFDFDLSSFFTSKHNDGQAEPTFGQRC